MSLRNALTSVTNVYVGAQTIYNDMMVQTIKTAETEYREVIMAAMRVLISDQTFDEPTTLAAMNNYQGVRTLLQQIKDIRFGHCPNDQYNILCDGFRYFIALSTTAQTLESLQQILNNIHISVIAVHNTFAAELGDVFTFEAIPEAIIAVDSPENRAKYVQYLRRAVFLLLQKMSENLYRLSELEQSVVLVYMQMRLNISLESNQRIMDSRGRYTRMIEIAQGVYNPNPDNNLRGLLPNVNKLVHYTSSTEADANRPIIMSTRLLDFDPNNVNDGWDVTVAECATQITLGNRANEESERRRGVVIRTLRDPEI